MAGIGKNIDKAIELLTSGEVVAIPTETVYGLAANAMDLQAVDKIYRVKQRPKNNPLIIHIAHRDQLHWYASHIPPAAFQLAAEFWPGPLTLVLPKTPDISSELTAQQTTVAIRVPQHPLTLDLLRQLPFPLAAPSANPYGYISPTTALHVKEQLGHVIPYILDGGPCQAGIESTIVGFENNSPVIYRKGMVTIHDLERVIGKTIFKPVEKSKVVTAGMALSHYAPKTPLYLTKDITKTMDAFEGKNLGLLLFKDQHFEKATLKKIVLSASGQLAEAAHHLYEALHTLDAMKVDAILAEWMPDEGVGAALNDRLRRAAFKVLE